LFTKTNQKLLITYRVKDIRNACPDVSDSTINRVFRKLKKEGVIEVLGKGMLNGRD